jgi:hypothetical protein
MLPKKRVVAIALAIAPQLPTQRVALLPSLGRRTFLMIQRHFKHGFFE